MGLDVENASDGSRQLIVDGLGRRPLARWEPLRASQKGAVFIIASGPSVADFPIESFASYPMIAMNGSISIFDQFGIQPLFYLCDDPEVANKKSPAVAQGIASAKWSALGLGAMHALANKAPHALMNEQLLLMERVNRWLDIPRKADRAFAWSVRKDADFALRWSLFSQTANRIGFSRNFGRGYFSARTIAYAAIQLAYYLGFSQVFLVGVDMNSSLGQFYDPAGSQVASRLDGDFDGHILPHFEILSRLGICPEFQVFNLSSQSRIPASLIPKLEMHQVADLIAAPLLMSSHVTAASRA